MKRFDEMNEQELMEARMTMTPEEIKVIMEEEEKGLEAHVQKMGYEVIEGLQQEVLPDEEAEEDEGERVIFNPSTGQVVSVESTLLVKEEDDNAHIKVNGGTISTGNISLVDMREEFSMTDKVVFLKAISLLSREIRDKQDKLDEDSFEHYNYPSIQEGFKNIINELSEERSEYNYFADAIRRSRTDKNVSVKERFNEMSEKNQKTLMKKAETILGELLDIL